MKRMLSFLAALTLGNAVVEAADPADAVVAHGNGIEVRQSELNSAFAHFQAELGSTGRLLQDDESATARSQLFDRVLLLHLCRARATPADLERARRESTAFIARLKTEHGDDGFRRLITRAGYGEPEFATNKLSEAVVTAVIDREVKGEVRIPTADRRKFYDANPDRWIEPATVRVSWLPLLLVDLAKGAPLPTDVVARKHALAVALRDRARNGEDFGALVKANSDDPKSREGNGEQIVARGQILSEIEEPAFRLEPGAVSDPIEFPGGIGILKVLARQLPSRIPFEQADQQINDLLVQREVQARIPEFVARIRREASLEIVPSTGTPQPKAR